MKVSVLIIWVEEAIHLRSRVLETDLLEFTYFLDGMRLSNVQFPCSTLIFIWHRQKRMQERICSTLKAKKKESGFISSSEHQELVLPHISIALNIDS